MNRPKRARKITAKRYRAGKRQVGRIGNSGKAGTARKILVQVN